ncbi:hypothetical protein P280DRAFT_103389 [Massarina eburnea CBS 473.64]|uniref:BZIP domain-containing protein n=1 Tax=Massarina eburnea CBS 473.64 TaxID=1395130 RepID=A0A6A6RPX7_9PLEO|nr:hypothetical protein P280DRAFT_103389 [Massarina eburnea CBS 473.64]
MPSSDSDGQPPPRKRSRTSPNANAGDEVGSKKARGRPRVDTQDETAADRRRTQIRLAQRAYRQRKETTISSLQDKNSRLQSIIEQMNKNFLQFNDAALKSGLVQLNPSLGHHLKQVTENFAALSRSASDGSLEGDEESGEATANIEAKSLPEAQARPQTYQESQSRMDIGWGYSTALPEAARQHGSERTEQEPRAASRNIFLPAPTTTNAPLNNNESSSIVKTRPPVQVGHVMDQTVSWGSGGPDDRDSSESLPFGLVDLLSRQQYSGPGSNPHIYSVDIPTPEATPPTKRLPTPPYLPSLSTKTMVPPWTYSHDETTFARRLTRAALETGFHLLSAADQRPAALNHVFRLSLPYKSLDELRERFRIMLARGTKEDLDSWDSPFIHLGGAGTHYPRKDAQGNIVARPNSWTVRRIGPVSSNMVRAENSVDPSKSYDMNIDLTGFEGEWFDACDVEGYLEHEKGCRIDPKSSFAEVLIDDNEEPAAEDLNVASNAFRMSYSHPPPPRMSPDLQSDTPSFSGASSSSGSLSSMHTPTNDGTVTSGPSLDSIFAQSNEPFGLDMDMGMNLNSLNANFPPTDFEKFAEFFDQPLGLDLAPGFDFTLSHSMANLPQINFDKDADMGALGLDLMGGPARTEGSVEQIPIVRQKKKKAAWVDVSKLVDEIIKHGVCLGRAPGFRRKDVDMAFQASIITAF